MTNVYKEHIDEIGKENETDFIQTVNSFSEYVREEINGHNGKSILIIAVAEYVYHKAKKDNNG